LIVRGLALALLVSFRLASIFGQATYEEPAIGRCTTNALRIRSFPSLKEGSSSIVGMDGAIGWSFGGYIDSGTAKLRVLLGSDEDFGAAESEASDALASEGVACRLFRFIGNQAVFVKTAAGRPQFIYLRSTDSPINGYASVQPITAADYFGDSSKELCVEMEGGAGDEVGRAIYLYGRSAQENRYTAYGSIGLGGGSGGGGWEFGNGSHVIEGPSPFIVGKNRCIRFVKSSIDISPVEDRGDGIRRRRIDKKEFEELYALSGSKLALLRTTTYSVDTSEEEQPSPKAASRRAKGKRVIATSGRCVLAARRGAVAAAAYRLPFSPISAATGRSANIVSCISSSSGMPSMSAPFWMTERSIFAAKAGVLSFLVTDLTSISRTLFEGRMMAQAAMKPVSSSQAKRIISM
jgi:hypothetical protein